MMNKKCFENKMASVVPFMPEGGSVKNAAEQYDLFFKKIKQSQKTLLSSVDQSGNWNCFTKEIYKKFPGSEKKIHWMLPNELDYLLIILNNPNIDFLGFLQKIQEKNVDENFKNHLRSVFDRFKKINKNKLVAFFLNGPSSRPEHIEMEEYGYRKTLFEHLVQLLIDCDFEILLIVPEPDSMFNKDPKRPNIEKHNFNYSGQIFSERLCREEFEKLTGIRLINLFYVPEDIEKKVINKDGREETKKFFPGNTTQKEIVIEGQSKPVILYLHVSRYSEWRYSSSYFFDAYGNKRDDMHLTSDVDDFLNLILENAKKALDKQYNSPEQKYGLRPYDPKIDGHY